MASFFTRGIILFRLFLPLFPARRQALDTCRNVLNFNAAGASRKVTGVCLREWGAASENSQLCVGPNHAKYRFTVVRASDLGILLFLRSGEPVDGAVDRWSSMPIVIHVILTGIAIYAGSKPPKQECWLRKKTRPSASDDLNIGTFLFTLFVLCRFIGICQRHCGEIYDFAFSIWELP